MMLEWAKAQGLSVRQRSMCQETTMARAGMLLDYLSQKYIQVGEKINFLRPPHQQRQNPTQKKKK